MAPIFLQGRTRDSRVCNGADQEGDGGGAEAAQGQGLGQLVPGGHRGALERAPRAVEHLQTPLKLILLDDLCPFLLLTCA